MHLPRPLCSRDASPVATDHTPRAALEVRVADLETTVHGLLVVNVLLLTALTMLVLWS